ncbi:MAG TPA: OstA-like protein [Armatimonadota bacterium]|nr:OstA-like protein [Armatimonadota bacterium]
MSARSVMRRAGIAVFIVLLVGASASWLAAAGTKKLRVESSHVISTKKTDKVRETVLAEAKILHEDAVFTAKTIVMQSEDNVHEFTCTGNPVFTDTETKITARKVVGLSTPRRAEFSGDVKMVSTPKKKAKDGEKPGEVRDTVKGEPTTLTSDTLSYDYANKLGAAKGNVVVVQKHRTVWADEGYYDQNLEKILLKGNVRLKNTGEEELKELKDADTVTVSLEDDWIDIQAKPGGVVIMDLDVKDDDEKTPAKSGEKK